MGRILLFGGTFDPIHFGHLRTATAAREELAATQVLLIPAAQSPHKQDSYPSSPAHRLAMIQLAIVDDSSLALSDLEILRAPPSYTVDTVAAVSHDHPRSELILLMGADQLPRLHTWYKVNDILESVTIAVLQRPGHDIDLSAVTQTLGPRLAQRIKLLSTPLIDISATDIRHRIQAGESISDLVPPAVEKYIREHRLYLPDALTAHGS